MAQPNAPYPTGGDYEIHRAAHDAHSLHSETDKKDAETRAVVNELHPELHNEEVDHAYLNAGKWTKLYRGVLWQMVMFGLLSFVGPAMNDGIGNLGGGGLSTPYLANLASCLNYSFSAGTALFGGPLINKIGIKYSALFCGIFMFLNGSAYYCNVKYKLDAYLLAARAFGGITSAFLYVAESTAMLSYPYADERGKYLGIWASMRNSGAIVGGVINFANNANSATAGGVAVSTYLIFMAFELTGPIWALLLSQTHRVRRRDGTHVPTTKTVSWKAEFIALAKHLKSRRVILMFFPAFYSFFTGGVYGTYLSLHFSVRARSLSTIIYPIFSIVLVLLFGLILDNKRWTPRTRGLIAIAFWAIPQAGCYIWTGIEYTRFAADGKNIAFDYAYTGAGSTPSRWAEAYLPYLIVSSMTYPMQMSVYWVLGTFSTDVKSASRTGGLFRSFETLGQAISYGINANTGDKRIPFYIICGIYCIAVPSMYLLVRMIPDTPSEVDDVVQSEQLAVMEAKATAAQTQQ